MFPFTDKPAYDDIAPQPDWLFKASQPPPAEHPFGAYFTTLEPATGAVLTRPACSR